MTGIYRNSNACFSLFPSIRFSIVIRRCGILSCISSLCLQHRCCQAKNRCCCKQSFFYAILVSLFHFSKFIIRPCFLLCISTLPAVHFSFFFESFQFRILISIARIILQFPDFPLLFLVISAALKRFKSVSYLALMLPFFLWFS